MSRLVQRLRDASRQLTLGFTLVELMVALTGGLFVSVAVFMLAKQATGLYQSEARMSNATLGSVVGFERLRMDIERASFLVSPNILSDPNACPKRMGVADASWPAYLRHLSGIFIQPTDISAMPVQQGNHLTPDEITLAGSYASSDQFWTQSIVNGGASNIVTLEPTSPAMARLGYSAQPTAAEQRALLLTVFGQGRALRIVDTELKEQYGTITDVQGGSAPAILLDTSSPAILYRGSNTTGRCGVIGVGLHHFVNVVNFVKYSIKDMSTDSRYAPLFSSGGGGFGAIPPTDVGRTELVREELNTAGVSITNSAEIVAEFAVDLRFGVTVAEVASAGSGSQIEQLETLAPGSATTAWAGNTTTLNLATQGPQRIRGVRARLSVRSREGDRLAGMPDGGGIIGPGLFRIGLGANGHAPFARVRTVQADIAIRNQRGIAWPP